MSTQISSLDLSLHHSAILHELYDAIQRVVESSTFIMGPEVKNFEAEFAKYIGSKHCVGTSSGTDSLVLALMALDVKPGDEIITTPFTFFATAGAIARLGATPVFADIDYGTFNLSTDSLDKLLTSKTKGIIPVHLYGQCSDMEPIVQFAQANNLFIVEDAAQAVGAEYQNKRAGTIGTVGCFSFFPAKNLGAFGDAGAVTTNDDELAEKMRTLRLHGSKPKYYHSVVGGNFRLDSIQAAVLRVKLRYLDIWISARQQVAQTYSELLTSAKLCESHITLPTITSNRHVFNQFVLRVRQRDALAAHLKEHGISSAVYYPLPLHLQKCFADLGYQVNDFPVAEEAANSTLAIPIYPELTYEQQSIVVDCMQKYYASTIPMSSRNAA